MGLEFDVPENYYLSLGEVNILTLSQLQFNKWVYSSHWFSDPKNKISRDNNKGSERLGFTYVLTILKNLEALQMKTSDWTLVERRIWTQTVTTLLQMQWQLMRGGRRVSQRTEEGVRERSRISGSKIN